MDEKTRITTLYVNCMQLGIQSITYKQQRCFSIADTYNPTVASLHLKSKIPHGPPSPVENSHPTALTASGVRDVRRRGHHVAGA